MSESTHCNERPERLDDAEGPRARQESVDARQDTPQSEGDDESSRAFLQGVHQHHETHGDHAVERDHDNVASRSRTRSSDRTWALVESMSAKSAASSSTRSPNSVQHSPTVSAPRATNDVAISRSRSREVDDTTPWVSSS